MKTNANTVRIMVIVLAWILLTAILILVSPKQTPTPTQYKTDSVICSDGSNATVHTETISGETIVTYWCDGGAYDRH